MAANFADLWESTPTNSMAGLKGDFASRIAAANEAWQTQTGKPLPISSGYRTPEEGIKLWGNRASNPNLVARPGTSLHEKGIAADISPDVPNEFLSQYGLHRPFGAKDPVHVEANPSFKSKGVSVSGTPTDNNFADLWESTGEVTPTEAKTTAKPKGFAEIAKSAQESNKPIADIGTSLASLGDIALGIVPATVGGVTYAGARALQKTPEEAQVLAQKVSAPLENPIGKAMGVTEQPAYKQEATRQAMEAIGQYVGESADAISQKTGIPKSDVENMIQTPYFCWP